MAELKEGQLIFVDENQNEVLCDILFTYDSEEFGKSYVFFSPVTGADDEGREVAVASFKPTEDGIGELEVVETEEEWDMLEDVFEAFAEEHGGCDCGCEGDCDCDGDCDCEEEECNHEGCCCHHHNK